MGIQQFSDEIARFLVHEEPSVLCITGKWGVGKTFAWNLYLSQAQQRGQVALSRYAYVSLFGQNSLNDIRHAIFENTIPRERIGTKPDLTTLKTSLDTILAGWRSWLKHVQYVPRVGDYAMSLARLGFIGVREQIVCIDDLERAGTGLPPKDVLGLVSFLKEERECKVVLLLNDEAFPAQAGADFRSQLEKVADTVLRFDPTPSEAAEIGVDKSTSFHEWLRTDCVGLGVVNIRLIKRIERFARRLEEELKVFDPRVLQQAVHSAALFIFAKYQPDTAPSLEFIKGFNPYDGLLGPDGNEDPDAGWRALLRQFGWTHTDEFDAVILVGFEQGNFDRDALKTAAEKQDRLFKLKDKDQSFSKAWDAYHDSFDDDADAVLDGLEEAIRKNASAIDPVNLSGTIVLLKEMGRGAKARELVQAYVDARDERQGFWDLSNNTFRRNVKDPDVIEAFKRKHESIAEKRDRIAVLKRIGIEKAWDPEDVTFLASLTADDFFKIFKARRGDELRRVIYGAFMFRNISNADAEMKTVTKNAEEGMRKIGKESAINARRVKQYGIDVGASG